MDAMYNLSVILKFKYKYNYSVADVSFEIFSYIGVTQMNIFGGLVEYDFTNKKVFSEGGFSMRKH